MEYIVLLLYAAVLELAASVPVFDLKIEYNATSDKHTALDKMDIAFVNKVNLNETALINNLISDGKLLLASTTDKHPLHIADSLEKHSNTESNILVSNNENTEKSNILAINNPLFKQLQSNNIKQNLNDFAMTKKNSFYVTPAFKHPNFNKNEFNDDTFEVYNNVPLDNDLNTVKGKLEYVKQLNIDNVFGNNLATDRNNKEMIKSDGAKSIYDRIKRYNQNLINQKDKNEDRDILSMLNHPEIADILKKQNSLIEKLESYLRTETTPKLRSDFDDLLQSIEQKKNRTAVLKQERIAGTTTASTRLTTVMAMVDQEEVRKALQKDPFVQRILKMAKQKKIEYMKKAKKHYGNMLYI